MGGGGTHNFLEYSNELDNMLHWENLFLKYFKGMLNAGSVLPLGEETGDKCCSPGIHFRINMLESHYISLPEVSILLIKAFVRTNLDYC